MRLTLTIPFAGLPLRDHEPLVRRAEELGYAELWSAETSGPDGFTPLALAAAWTREVKLGTGVVNPYTRGLPLLAQSCAALADASGGRFVLGLGASSDVIVERWNGVPFTRPLTRMREAIETLRPIFAGGRGPGGFKLDTAPEHEIPIVVAALRDRMLQLAGAHGDGAFANFLPLSGVRHVVSVVRDAAGERDCEVMCRFFTLPQPEDEALPVARRMFAAYATVPVYAEFFRALGWAERIDPMVEAWRAGDRALALERVPDELVREVFVFGSPEQIRERLGEFGEAGIANACLLLLAPPEAVGDLLGALAP